MGLGFWGRVSGNASMSTASPACSWALASCAGFPVSETAGSSLLPLRTWGYVNSRLKASLGHLSEIDRRRQTPVFWAGGWGLGADLVGHENVHAQG